jgi:hypothetical protein
MKVNYLKEFFLGSGVRFKSCFQKSEENGQSQFDLYEYLQPSLQIGNVK